MLHLFILSWWTALHAGMERMKTCLKVSRAASKKPQSRSNMDINLIAAETQAVQLLMQQGPAVHRDLCHVVQHCSLAQIQSIRLPGEHPDGLFIYVSNCGLGSSLVLLDQMIKSS